MPIIGATLTTCEPLKPIYREYAERFEKLLRMSTYPLAVKMLEKDEDIPKLAKRPLRDFGHHMYTCQCFAVARRNGEMIAQKQEDMWCFEAAIGYGFTGGNIEAFNEGLKFFLDGKTRYPSGARNLAVASKWAYSFPRFEPDKYVAIVIAPLMRAGFEPDVVVLYINPCQLTQILAGIMTECGEGVTCDLSAAGGCVHYVVPPMRTGGFWVSCPCFGDQSMAASPFDELVFSTPLAKVEQLLAGMEHRVSYRGGMPFKYQLEPEGWLPDEYAEIARIMKMHRASV